MCSQQIVAISNRANAVITAIYRDSNRRIAGVIRFPLNDHNTLSYRRFYAIG